MKSDSQRLCQNLRHFGVAGGLDRLAQFYVSRILSGSRNATTEFSKTKLLAEVKVVNVQSSLLVTVNFRKVQV